jgi:hypothetical protein
MQLKAACFGQRGKWQRLAPGNWSTFSVVYQSGSELPHAKGFAELGGFGENNSSNTSIGLFGSRE